MESKKLQRQNEKRILMGNEAMGRGLVEAGVTLAASYPGTPASEIFQAVATLRQRDRGPSARRVVRERKGGL